MKKTIPFLLAAVLTASDRHPGAGHDAVGRSGELPCAGLRQAFRRSGPALASASLAWLRSVRAPRNR